MEDLREETWIEGRLCNDALSHAPLGPPASSRASPFDSAEWLGKQGLVAAGVGIALIPTLALGTIREGLVLRSLGPDGPRRHVSLATHAWLSPAPAVAPMKAILRRVALEHCFTCDALVAPVRPRLASWRRRSGSGPRRSAGTATATRPRRSAGSRSRRSPAEPIKPLYGPEDVGPFDERIGFPGEYPFTRGVYPSMYRGPPVDDAPVRRLRHRRGDQRALPLPARPRADGALDRVRHAVADGPRLRPSALARRGRPRGRGDRHARRHGRRCSAGSTSARSRCR